MSKDVADDPKWYDVLPKEQKDEIDQAAHWSIGLVSSFLIRTLLIPLPGIGIAVNLITVLLRELVFSGQIERPGDTVKDSQHWMTGAILGELMAGAFIPVWWTLANLKDLFI
jgi:hypothetical protein